MTTNQIIARSLTVESYDDGYWIEGDLEEYIGPYRTRALAEEDRQGLKRFFRHEHEAGYVSIDSPSSPQKKGGSSNG